VGKGRLLVVDDEPEVRSLLGRVLRHAGYEVEVAADASAALGRLKDAPPFDVVVVDLIMQPMEGLPMVRAIRAANPAQRLFMVSGKLVGASERQELAALGIPFCAKPFRNSDILRTIELLLK